MPPYSSVRIAAKITLAAILFAPGNTIAISQVNPGNATKYSIQQVATVPVTPPAAKETISAPITASRLDKADLEAFMDGVIPIQLDRSDVAGAAVFVVQNNDVLLLKGYGYADMKKQIPVDVNVTGFRPGSISKLFTWISVMQLVEDGKINLDADVNQYLDFKIHEPWGKPVTMRDLMTHHPGFEDTARYLMRKAPAKPLSLRQYLIENQPAQIFPPGTIPGYSNYGAGLAGYIVQRISGERFEDYVRQHIFAPLGMTHSTFEQPLPKNWPIHSAEGYGVASQPMYPFEIVMPASAGALTTTAADMVRFAEALLNGGELDGQQILKQETLTQMWTRQFPVNPAMPAWCLGFHELFSNGQRWIGHRGDLIAYHSMLMIQPEKKIAIFVSYNSAGTDAINKRIGRVELFNQFTDRYFPQGVTSTPKKIANPTPLPEVTGTYWTTRRGVKNRLQMLNFTNQIHATVGKDGKLVIDGMQTIEGPPVHWEPAGHDLWVYPREKMHLAAIRNEQGEIVRIITDFPAVEFQRVPFYARDKINLWLLGLSLFICFCMLWAAVLRWHQHGRTLQANIIPQKLRTLQVWASLWWMLTAAGVWVLLHTVFSPTAFFPDDSADKWLMILNIVVSVALVLTVWLVVETIRTWNALPKGFWLHLRMSMVLLAVLFLSWFSIYWKVLGPVHHF